MFFQPGEYVIYGCKGVHKIMDRVMLAIDGTSSEKEYYVMQPCGKSEGFVYAPVDASKTHMRRIMKREEAEQFLRTAPQIQLLDIHSRKLLEDACKECIRSCEPEELMRVIRTLHQRKEARLHQGKKMTLTDIHYMEQAENILYMELSIIFDIPKAEVPEFIHQHVAPSMQEA